MPVQKEVQQIVRISDTLRSSLLPFSPLWLMSTRRIWFLPQRGELCVGMLTVAGVI